jgi:DNA-binding NarL/FixJ family response regulator
MTDTPLRILLVDDHPIVRYGFARLLAAEPDFVVCGEAADPRGAIALLASDPHVAIVDVTLGEASGIDLTRELKVRAPSLAVLVISIHDEGLYAERALRAGASGYVMKHEATEHIVRAIRCVAAGNLFVSETMSSRFVRRVAGTGERSPLAALSDRELHVLKLLGRGLGTRAIAEQLHVSIKTVESYRARLKEKMQLRSGVELVRYAVRWAETDDA